jgi:hypothetical protein
LEKKIVEQFLEVGEEGGGKREEVTQKMYTHISKCKKDKRKKENSQAKKTNLFIIQQEHKPHYRREKF